MDIMDILELFPEFLNRKRRNVRIKNNKINVKEEYKKIYDCLSDNFLNIDRIVFESGKDLREVINVLTLMEIDGLVEFKMGIGYRKKEV